MNNRLDSKWANFLEEEFKKDYFQELKESIDREYRENTVFPEKKDLFNAFNYTDFDSLKVIILGQDPYHGQGQGMGLAFSVKDGVKIPPSLRNIFKELNDDLDIGVPKTGSLIPWARQGVLLINTVFTVREGQANSHKGLGWEIFTDNIIKKLSREKESLIFILWGRQAQEKESLLDLNKHYVIKSSHPSPFSAYRGFFGSRPFSKVNKILKANKKKAIDWSID